MILPPNTEVRFRDENGTEHRAQIVRPVSQIASDLVIYDGSGRVVRGYTEAEFAATPEDRAQPLRWWTP